MLRIEGLVAGYAGAGRVLDGVDLEIGSSESVGLLGRNGMGKTTLLRTIMGLVAPAAGSTRFEGRDLTGARPFAVSHAGIAYVPQGREIFNDFTVEQNLLLGLIGKSPRAVQVPDSIYQRFPILAQRRTQKAGTLSGGEQQQLAIARAIVSRPRLLLLDEPTEGIQPSIVQSIGDTLSAIAAEEGMSVFLVEQNIDLVLALTTRCLFMENGKIAEQVNTAQLTQDAALVDRYLAI